MASASSVVRFGVLFAIVLILQVSVAAQLTLLSVVVDLFALAAVAAGMNGGAERGVLIGFAAGLLADLLVHTPFGLVTMVLTLVGYAAGTLSVQVAQLGLALRSLVAGGLAAGTVLTFVSISWLLDLTYVTESGFGRIAVVNGIAATLIYPLAELAVRWALRLSARGAVRGPTRGAGRTSASALVTGRLSGGRISGQP